MLACVEPGGGGGPGNEEGGTVGGGRLTADKWSVGFIADSNDTIRYTINASASTVYRLWFNNRSTGDGTKTLATAFSVTYEGNAAGSSTMSGVITVTSSGTVVITVRPSTTGFYNTGSFTIAYTVGSSSTSPAYPSFAPPAPIALEENTWEDGVIVNSSDYIWYSINVTALQTYNLWWNDSFQGNSTMTADIAVNGFYSDGTSITGLNNNIDSGWTTAQPFIPNSTGKIFIRVSILPNAGNSQRSGTFGLVYSTETTRPSFIKTDDAIPLTLGEWTEGVIDSTNNVIWYSVTAESAATHYFWWNDAMQGNGNATVDVSVSAFRSNDASVFNQDHGWTTMRTASMTNGEIIYLRVAPKKQGETGSFNLIYTTASTRPWLVPNNAITLIKDEWMNDEIITGSNSEKWYSFDADADAQYRIWWDDGHQSSNTKTLDVRVLAYYNDGTQIFSQDNGWSTAQNFSPTTTGKIFISVVPWTTGNSGTFGIVYTKNETTRPSLNNLPQTSTTIILNQWVEGEITASTSVIWYSFTSSSSGNHFFWWNDSNQGNNSKTLDISVSVFRDTEAAPFHNVDSGWYSSQQLSLTLNETIYIRVMPKVAGGTGSFSLVCTATNTRPFITPAGTTPLTENQWIDGSITSGTGGETWYTFTAEAGTPYYIWWNDSEQGNNFKNLNVSVSAFSSDGTILLQNTNSGWTTSQSITPSAEGTVYIRVSASSVATGTFGIVYSTDNTRPVPPLPAMTLLTEEQWTTGNIALNGEQWFSFTATAATQYIHFIWGSLNDVNIQLYSSDLSITGTQSNLYLNTRNANRSLTVGQTYYIRVWPYYSSGYGDFLITFNASTTAPAQ